MLVSLSKEKDVRPVWCVPNAIQIKSLIDDGRDSMSQSLHLLTTDFVRVLLPTELTIACWRRTTCSADFGIGRRSSIFSKWFVSRARAQRAGLLALKYNKRSAVVFSSDFFYNSYFIIKLSIGEWDSHKAEHKADKSFKSIVLL